jgi:hypothetical protein
MQRSKMDRYSITSSARTSSANGTVMSLRGLQVDHQLASSCLRQIGGFSPLLHLNDSETVLPILLIKLPRPGEAMPE